MKKRKSEPEQPEIFYIGVNDTVEVRKNILECAKEGILLLQRYEKLKAVREEKLQEARSIDEAMKELRSLMNQLRKMLPTPKIAVKLPVRRHDLREEAPPGRKTLAQEAKKEEEEVVPASELDQLEKELSDIEGKLNTVG